MLLEDNNIESLKIFDWTKFNSDINRVVFLHYSNSSYFHFKDLNLLSSTSIQECKKAIDNLIKEIKDQKLNYLEEEEIEKNYVFQLGKGGFNNSRYRLNIDIHTNLAAYTSHSCREFLIYNDKSSNYACHLFKNLKEFKYSQSKIKEFNG